MIAFVSESTRLVFFAYINNNSPLISLGHQHLQKSAWSLFKCKVHLKNRLVSYSLYTIDIYVRLQS